MSDLEVLLHAAAEEGRRPAGWVIADWSEDGSENGTTFEL